MIKLICLVLPWEVFQFQRICRIFLQGLKYLNDTDRDKIKFQFTYSDILNQIKWNSDKTKINKEICQSVFKNTCNLMKTHFNVSFELNNNILGCVGHRRREFNKNDYDYCITFDSDIDFDPTILKVFLHSLNELPTTKIKIDKNKIEYTEGTVHIITPQLPMYWDSSWDSISKCKFSTWKWEEFKNSSNRYFIINQKDDVYGKEIDTFKWFGGMFPCYPKSFLHKYPLTDSLGDGYGSDDTYLMRCAAKDKYISQIVLENLIVFDNGRDDGLFSTKEFFDLKFYRKN